LSRRRVLVVVSEHDDAKGFPDAMVATAPSWIESVDAPGGAIIVNLCRTLGYGSDGYYVSLLADARGQLVIPRLETSTALADPYARFRALQEAGIATLDAGEMSARRRSTGIDTSEDAESAGLGAWPLVREEGLCRAALPDEVVELVACMGRTTDARFATIASAVFAVWPAPLLRIRVVFEEDEWKVAGVAHASPSSLDADERALLVRAVTTEAPALSLQATKLEPRDGVRASIAVLLDDSDPFSASSAETIDVLERVAARMNVHIARIEASELRRLPEYDALFIRSLTGVRQPSFQFALRAEALDMPVIDDPQSIIRCSNKVFLEELLRREGVPLPRARIVTAHTPWAQLEELDLPFVIKTPDGSFSAGVHKVTSREDFERHAGALFQHSPLLIAQEWLPTEFDWRVTVLDGKLLFAARYYMAQDHWQIRAEDGGVERYGKVEAVARADVPRDVVDVALRAAALIGNGLYGVDLKDTPRGPVVIEVNDNPNLDAGYEDTADGDVVYEDIIRFFLKQLEADEPEARTAPAAPPRARTSAAPRIRPTAPPYRLFEVAGLELEYPTVNEDLDVVALVEPAFRTIAGRGTSDVELSDVGFSNEIADHVFEVKTLEPVRSLRDAEHAIVGGVRRFSEVLAREWNARLLPTAMHPWFDPHTARLWTRSGLRIYTTYAQIFDIRTHGWMNVHATHLNLPFGDERETMAMHTAAALLLPYLPALAASSPVHDGRLQPFADARLAWILMHQSRIPQTCGRIVPEHVPSFAAYRRDILQPMYAALDQYPNSEPIRHEFLNSRGAVLRFARRALELRVLDTQECVRMDVAISVFARAAMRALTADVLHGNIEVPDHDALVADFEDCVRDGSAAVVRAPHLLGGCDEPCVGVRSVLRSLMDRAREVVSADEAPYLELVDRIIEQGSLSERLRARLLPFAGDDQLLRSELRVVYGELADCLVRNEPWRGREVLQEGQQVA